MTDPADLPRSIPYERWRRALDEIDQLAQRRGHDLGFWCLQCDYTTTRRYDLVGEEEVWCAMCSSASPMQRVVWRPEQAGTTPPWLTREQIEQGHGT